MDTNLPIGLNAEDSAALSKELNALLCDLHVFYQNVRGFHWNVQGQNFFELHLKFEEFYNDLQVKIDEVAERIYRRLMVCFREIGRPADAIDAYNRCCKTLKSRLAVGPSKETRSIYDALMHNQK